MPTLVIHGHLYLFYPIYVQYTLCTVLVVQELKLVGLKKIKLIF